MAQIMPATRARRRGTRSVLLCLVLLPLAQAGLGYAAIRAPSPSIWLAGTPLAYLLIGGLGGLSATGGLAPTAARRRGAGVGAVGGLSGAVVATLVTAAFIVWELTTPQPLPSHLGSGSPAFLTMIVLFLFGPAFLVVNLLGVASAALGGLCGGALRTAMQRDERPLPFAAGEPDRARGAVVIGVIAVTLAILADVATVLLSGGAFPALR